MNTKNKKRITFMSIFVSLTIVLTLNFTTTAFASNIDKFTDNNFRNYVLNNFDLDGDNEISTEEAEQVKKIDIHGMSIENVDGIEIFTNLEVLSCRDNNITSLDLSQNTKLKTLLCLHNKIENLNIANNKELTRLDCFDNKLNSLNLENNVKLEDLTCGANNFTTLDLSKNINLKNFTYLIGEITEIDFSNNEQLEYVWISTTPIQKLDLSNNPNLRQLLCYGTDIITIDLSNKPYLTGDNVNITSNKMISLHGNLTNNQKIHTQNQRAVTVDVDTSDTYDLRNLDKNINPENITNIKGGTINNGIVQNITDGMTITYTYKENGAELNATIIFKKKDIDDNNNNNSGEGENNQENNNKPNNGISNNDNNKITSSPNTSDLSNIKSWISVSIISISMLLILTIIKKNFTKNKI